MSTILFRETTNEERSEKRTRYIRVQPHTALFGLTNPFSKCKVYCKLLSAAHQQDSPLTKMRFDASASNSEMSNLSGLWENESTLST